MSGSEDSQNREMEEDIEMSSGTDPESSDSDPGSPSDHGLPPAATYARRKKNSDEEDSDFNPEVDSSKRSVVSKVYATPERVKSLARPQAEGSSAAGQSKPERERKRIVHVESRKAIMFVDPHADAAESSNEEEEEEVQVSKPPAKKNKLMVDAMPKSPPPASKPKPPPKGKGKSTVAAAAKKKKKAVVTEEEEEDAPAHLKKLRPFLPAHDDAHPEAEGHEEEEG